MPAPRKNPLELRERSVRLVAEAMTEDPSLTINGAVKRIGPRLGVVPDTLRSWVKQSHVDTARLPGTTSTDAAKIKKLEAELREVKFPCAGARPATAVVVRFITEHRVGIGVEPICTVLT